MVDAAGKAVEELERKFPEVEFIREVDNGMSKVVSELANSTKCPDGIVREGNLEFNSKMYQAKSKDEMKIEGCAVLYIHGGAFVMSCVDMYAAFLLNLSLKCNGIPVFAVEYPLCPEFEFPTAMECIASAYRNLVLRGFKEIVIMGDSAGGNLAVATVLKLLEVKENLIPNAIVALSPWLDLSNSGNSVVEKANVDPLIPVEMLSTAVRFYVKEEEIKNPLVSPLFASKEQVSKLPPMLLHVGENEVLLDDSVRFIKHLDSPHSELVIWQDMHHVFQMSIGTLKEADEALKQICEFINKQFTK
jgi:monoterpene epsilon-lactone hydrolase